LISDLEELREKWGIDKWTVFGAGAGGTFALAYAQQHPLRVTQLIASHPLLFREQDIDWLFKPKVGLSELMPMQFAQFVRPIARMERSDLLSAYHRRFCGDNSAYTTEETRRFVEAWSIWESVNSGIPAPDLTDPVAFKQAKNLARIECHYFINRAFLAEGQLLTGMDALRQHKIPGFIIRGENDLVSPESTSLAIAQAWPEARMIKVGGTHSLRDPAVQRSILRLTGEIAGCGCLF
jgi:proline iminopeptidase